MMNRLQLDVEALYRERFVGFRNALAPIVGPDAARDVVQEAFALALKDIHRLRRPRSLAPWVWQIAWRLALRERRRQRMTTELSDELSILDEGRDPALASAVRALPPRRRLVLFLRYYADFSYQEIAEALSIAPGTVAASISQAHAALLEQLDVKEVTL
jgi:RNA polymerase sigma-70 factor (ECF subfamily)